MLLCTPSMVRFFFEFMLFLLEMEAESDDEFINVEGMLLG